MKEEIEEIKQDNTLFLIKHILNTILNYFIIN